MNPIALLGHQVAQAPQKSQSWCQVGFPSMRVTFPRGQMRVQFPQLLHESLTS